MKILLLGSNGQLGSDFLTLAKSKANFFEVVPLNRKNLDLSKFKESYDFLNEQSFQVLINCAAYNRVEDAELNSTEAFAINTHAVKMMAEVCKNKQARFIQISTNYVFDGSKSQTYIESDPPSPLNVYGASKAMGERLAQFVHMDTLILRVASLFGVAGSSSKGGNFVETMIRVGKEKGELKVVNNITMSPTSSMDVAKMILTLVEKEASPGTYHAVNSGQATWYEFAREIFDQTRMNVKVISVKSEEYFTKALRPPYSVLDNSKISKTVGKIRHWKEALSDYLKEKKYL